MQVIFVSLVGQCLFLSLVPSGVPLFGFLYVTTLKNITLFFRFIVIVRELSVWVVLFESLTWLKSSFLDSLDTILEFDVLHLLDHSLRTWTHCLRILGMEVMEHDSL